MTFSKTTQTRIIFLIILLGSFLRLYNLGKESFRLDETQTIWQASHSLDFIRYYSAQNVHLPLFNILVNFWMGLGFTNESTLRILPVIFGILTLPFIYKLAMEILGDKTRALIVLFLAAVSPFLVWYSRETRPYSLMIFLSVLSYLLFIRAQNTPRVSTYLLLSIINILGVYTHYFFAMVLIIEFLYTIFRGERRTPFLLSLFITGAALIPWAVFFLINNKGADLSPALAYPNGIQIIVGMFELVFGFQPENISSPLLSLWPLVYLIGFLFLVRRKASPPKELLLTFLAAILPAVILVILTYTYKPMFLSRYMSFSTPLILIFTTWLLTNLAGKVRYISIVLFAVLTLAANYPQYASNDIYQKEDYRDAMSYISSNAGYRDVVLVSPLYTIYPAQYYYKGNALLTTLPLWDRSNLDMPAYTQTVMQNDSETIKSGHSKMFLLSTLNLDGGQQTKDFMDKHYRRLDVKQFSEYIWVSVYQAEYPVNSGGIANANTQ